MEILNLSLYVVNITFAVIGGHRVVSYTRIVS